MKTRVVKPPTGGMVNDPRSDGNVAQLIKHFDFFTKSKSLSPYKDSEEGFSTAAQADIKLKTFLMYGGSMYALGRQAATAKALIYKNTGIDAPVWSSPTNGQDGTYTIANYNFFIGYKGFLWGTNSNGLWSYEIAATTFTSAAQALTYTDITQGIVHSKDSKAYFAYYNSTAAYIASKNGSDAWNATGLTIPTTSHKPVSICEYGNYLAILMAPIASGLNSFVLFWDRDTSVNDVSETTNLGNIDGTIIGTVQGSLVVISTLAGLNSTVNTKIIFSYYNGNSFVIFNTIELAGGTIVIIGSQPYDNNLYFGLSATSVGGTVGDYSGVWLIRKNSSGQFVVSFDRSPKNNTPVFLVYGFIIVSGYMYISYLVTNGGSDYELSKTNDQAVYTTTSTWETKINPGMPKEDEYRVKQLGSVAIFTEKLTAGQVVVKYSVDGGAFSDAIITKTATSPDTDLIGYELAANAQLTKGREFQFRIESTLGAAITGLAYSYDDNLKTQLFK